MIIFQNNGLIDLTGLTTFGVCAKESDSPIGYFGTGLKYALAALLREGQKVTMYRGDRRFDFNTEELIVRGQGFSVLHMTEEGDSGEPPQTLKLPFTEELGKNWTLWMAYRELAANAMDEEGTNITKQSVSHDGHVFLESCTTFVVEGEAFEEVYDTRNTIFLDSPPTIQLEGVNIHDDIDAGHWLYYRGIRAYKLPKRAMYNYNITSDLKLTEDRTLSSVSDAYMAIAKAIAKCSKPALIRQLVMANQQFWESQIDYNWWHVTPGETFHEVIRDLIDRHTSFNRSVKTLHRQSYPENDLPNVVPGDTLPLEQRRQLWAARMFWQKLGIEIPKSIIHVTNGIRQKKFKTVSGQIFISQFVLEMGMRDVAGIMYKAYAATKPTVGNVKREDLLIDTIVDFGEQILGVSTKKEVA